MEITASILIAYVLGSIPSAVWSAKYFAGIDIREHGSKNAGLTNTYRVLGWKPALPVVILDLGKGIIAPFIATLLAPEIGWLPIAAGLVAVLGHSFTCFAKFKGGKGVLTALGVFMFLAHQEALVAFATWAVITYVTRYVSLASIVASIVLAAGLTVSFITPGRDIALETMILGWIIAAFVTIKHKANIQRLINGTENRFGKAKEEE
ncbi:MAG: glycerol-3-phosphate 1-O-acyltransferase PlsY [Fibrobacterales bacterium]